MECQMKINEAGWDRTLRIVIGLVAISLVFVGPKTMWGLLGIIPLATGVTGSCLLYSLLGVSTCPLEK
jgi:hypothetical protein